MVAKKTIVFIRMVVIGDNDGCGVGHDANDGGGDDSMINGGGIRR